MRVGTTEQQPKHLCVINTVPILNAKHSTAPAIGNKMNSIPVENRTYKSGAHPYQKGTPTTEEVCLIFSRKYCVVDYSADQKLEQDQFSVLKVSAERFHLPR